MPVQRLNHAVLYVRDVARSVAFYRDVLGFRTVAEIPGRAAFLQAEGCTNDHDLGLFAIGAGAGAPTAGARAVGLYHLAWEVDTLDELARISDGAGRAGALVGAATTAPPRRCTPRTPTAWSSRSAGWCRPTCWTTRRGPCGRRRWTWTPRSRGTAARLRAGSGCPFPPRG